MRRPSSVFRTAIFVDASLEIEGLRATTMSAPPTPSSWQRTGIRILARISTACQGLSQMGTSTTSARHRPETMSNVSRVAHYSRNPNELLCTVCAVLTSGYCNDQTERRIISETAAYIDLTPRPSPLDLVAEGTRTVIALAAVRGPSPQRGSGHYSTKAFQVKSMCELGLQM